MVTNDIIINYILIEKDLPDSPYPIAVPVGLFEGVSAGCRGFFVDEIAKEFRHDAQVTSLRFWKPTNSFSVDAPAETRRWIGALAEFDESFSMIPFTRSLASALEDTIKDRNLIHIAVTTSSFDIDNSQSPSRALLGPVVEMGFYEINKDRSWRSITEGERHAQDFTIPTRSTIPSILLGIQNLDIGPSAGNEINLHTYTDNLDSTSFRCHFDSWGPTKLYSGRLNYLLANPSPLLQSGSVDSQFYRCDKSGGDVIHRINFKQPFAAPPKVFIALSGFSLGGLANGSILSGAFNFGRKNETPPKHWEIRTLATNVDSRGFTVNIIKTNKDGGLGNGQVHWLAFPEGGVAGLRMSCGEFIGGANSSTKFDEHIEFDVAFTTEPKVFVALNQFDADITRNLRVRLEPSGVTTAGMDLKITAWGDTRLYTATASFLAIEEL